MKLNYPLIALFLCILNFNLWGQSTSSSQIQQIRCHTDELHALHMQDADYASKFSAYQTAALAAVQSNQKINCSNGVITIPIAVHYSGSVTNANPACLLAAAEAQVQALNQDFGAYNDDISNFCTIAAACPETFDPTALSTGACIQFCLATQNHPACSGLANGTPAITVGQFTFNNEAPCWSGYLNFFVNDGLPFLGQAILAGGDNPDGDGVNILASSFGGPNVSCFSGTGINVDPTFNLGRTGTHEVGHYFGLNHIFDGCGVGDGIADTPTQSQENFGCPRFDLGTCSSNAGNSCGTTDFAFNYMDYVNDECMYMFTDDQATLMYNTVSTHNLWVTNTCASDDLPSYEPIFSGPCTTAPPVANFQPFTSLTVCENNPTITFEDLSENFPSTHNWSFFGVGAAPSSSTAQNPTITVSSTGTLTAVLDVTNGSGSNSITQNFDVIFLPMGHPDCPNCSDAIIDGGFENNFWNESSSNGFAIVTDDFPQTGINGAWLGGASSEQSVIYQTVTIPANATSALLNYSYQIDTGEGCGGTSNDEAGIAVDPNGVDSNGERDFLILTTIDLCTSTHTNGNWINSTFDLSIYAGTTIDIGFYATTNGNDQISNFFVDNVDLEVCSTIPLSLELLKLEAVAASQQIDVKWSTTNEINNKGFELLRSINPSNGFEVIETIPAKDNGGNYLYQDLNVRAGVTYYYQLQQLDFDDTKNDLGIVSAVIRSEFEVEVTPNPATDRLSVHIANESKSTIRIDVVDIVGKVILSRNVALNGSEIINLDINILEAGVYLLNISDEGILLNNTRFVKH